MRKLSNRSQSRPDMRSDWSMSTPECALRQRQISVVISKVALAQRLLW